MRFICFVFCCLIQLHVLGASSNLIIPGKSVGEINDKTCHKDLIKIYGIQHIEPVEIIESEEFGNSHQTIIFNKDPQKKLMIKWSDIARDCYPESIIVFSKHWQTKEGISIKSKLDFLEKINKKAFNFYGLGWDEGGLITNAFGGELEALKKEGLIIYLGSNLKNQIIGDKEFKSSDKKSIDAHLEIIKIVIPIKRLNKFP